MDKGGGVKQAFWKKMMIFFKFKFVKPLNIWLTWNHLVWTFAWISNFTWSIFWIFTIKINQFFPLLFCYEFHGLKGFRLSDWMFPHKRRSRFWSSYDGKFAFAWFRLRFTRNCSFATHHPKFIYCLGQSTLDSWVERNVSGIVARQKMLRLRVGEAGVRKGGMLRVDKPSWEKGEWWPVSGHNFFRKFSRNLLAAGI